MKNNPRLKPRDRVHHVAEVWVSYSPAYILSAFITLPSGDLKNQHALVSFWQIFSPKWTLSWSVNKKTWVVVILWNHESIRDLCNAKFCLGRLYLQFRLKKSKEKEAGIILFAHFVTGSLHLSSRNFYLSFLLVFSLLL